LPLCASSHGKWKRGEKGKRKGGKKGRRQRGANCSEKKKKRGNSSAIKPREKRGGKKNADFVLNPRKLDCVQGDGRMGRGGRKVEKERGGDCAVGP